MAQKPHTSPAGGSLVIPIGANVADGEKTESHEERRESQDSNLHTFHLASPTQTAAGTTRCFSPYNNFSEFTIDDDNESGTFFKKTPYWGWLLIILGVIILISAATTVGYIEVTKNREANQEKENYLPVAGTSSGQSCDNCTLFSSTYEEHGTAKYQNTTWDTYTETSNILMQQTPTHHFLSKDTEEPSKSVSNNGLNAFSEVTKNPVRIPHSSGRPVALCLERRDNKVCKNEISYHSSDTTAFTVTEDMAERTSEMLHCNMSCEVRTATDSEDNRSNNVHQYVRPLITSFVTEMAADTVHSSETTKNVASTTGSSMPLDNTAELNVHTTEDEEKTSNLPSNFQETSDLMAMELQDPFRGITYAVNTSAASTTFSSSEVLENNTIKNVHKLLPFGETEVTLAQLTGATYLPTDTPVIGETDVQEIETTSIITGFQSVPKSLTTEDKSLSYQSHFISGTAFNTDASVLYTENLHFMSNASTGCKDHDSLHTGCVFKASTMKPNFLSTLESTHSAPTLLVSKHAVDNVSSISNENMKVDSHSDFCGVLDASDSSCELTRGDTFTRATAGITDVSSSLLSSVLNVTTHTARSTIHLEFSRLKDLANSTDNISDKKQISSAPDIQSISTLSHEQFNVTNKSYIDETTGVIDEMSTPSDRSLLTIRKTDSSLGSTENQMSTKDVNLPDRDFSSNQDADEVNQPLLETTEVYLTNSGPMENNLTVHRELFITSTGNPEFGGNQTLNLMTEAAAQCISSDCKRCEVQRSTINNVAIVTILPASLLEKENSTISVTDYVTNKSSQVEKHTQNFKIPTENVILNFGNSTVDPHFLQSRPDFLG